MSTERDELAVTITLSLDAIHGIHNGIPAVQDYELADAILAGGYRKPQQVTTVRELHALPNESVIRTDKGFVFEKDGHWWAEPGTRDKSLAVDIALPATVLHVGGTQ